MIRGSDSKLPNSLLVKFSLSNAILKFSRLYSLQVDGRKRFLVSNLLEHESFGLGEWRHDSTQHRTGVETNLILNSYPELDVSEINVCCELLAFYKLTF